MDANANAITRARQIAKDFINRVGDWYNEKAVSKAIEYMGEIYNLSNDPLRNCDVGTADEQAERFENFCLNHIGCAEETGGRHCIGCPLEKASKHITQKCELYWAQMPYEPESEM